jgi:hypothetical protein
MARRPNTGRREQLKPGELEELRRRLLSLPNHELESFYKSTHNACRYEVLGRVPSPRIMQELITAWKVLRKVAKW